MVALRRGLFVVRHELHTVEAHKSRLGRQPDISVPGLKKGVDGVLGQAAVSLPGALTVLAELFLRIKTEGEGGGDGEPDEQAGTSTPVIRNLFDQSPQIKRLNVRQASFSPIVDDFRANEGSRYGVRGPLRRLGRLEVDSRGFS